VNSSHTSLTQEIQSHVVVSDWCGIGPPRYRIGGFSPQQGASSMVLNVFAHAVGLEVGSFFDVSDPQIGTNTREYQGESSALTFPKIPTGLAGNAVGKTAGFRRVSGSRESFHVLAPAARSSPRILASVPSPYLDNTHVKLFGKWFSQIIPLGILHTLLLGTNFIPLLQVPRFCPELSSMKMAGMPLARTGPTWSSTYRCGRCLWCEF
jgi:hypothetical protein